MNIAYQSATTDPPVQARARHAGSPHQLVLTEHEPRAWTIVKLVGLLALTAFGAALATAILAGTALFALLNFS